MINRNRFSRFSWCHFGIFSSLQVYVTNSSWTRHHSWQRPESCWWWWSSSPFSSWERNTASLMITSPDIPVTRREECLVLPQTTSCEMASFNIILVSHNAWDMHCKSQSGDSFMSSWSRPASFKRDYLHHLSWMHDSVLVLSSSTSWYDVSHATSSWWSWSRHKLTRLSLYTVLLLHSPDSLLTERFPRKNDKNTSRVLLRGKSTHERNIEGMVMSSRSNLVCKKLLPKTNSVLMTLVSAIFDGKRGWDSRLLMRNGRKDIITSGLLHSSCYLILAFCPVFLIAFPQGSPAESCHSMKPRHTATQASEESSPFYFTASSGKFGGTFGYTESRGIKGVYTVFDTNCQSFNAFSRPFMSMSLFIFVSRHAFHHCFLHGNCHAWES